MSGDKFETLLSDAAILARIGSVIFPAAGPIAVALSAAAAAEPTIVTLATDLWAVFSPHVMAGNALTDDHKTEAAGLFSKIEAAHPAGAKVWDVILIDQVAGA